MGGDEFALLLTGAHDERTVVNAAERACAAIAEADGRVSACYGLARWPADGPDDDAVLVAADVRLYAMKAARGRRATAAGEAADVPHCCPGRSARIAVLSGLSRRLAQVEGPREVIEVATRELAKGFPCYSVTIVAGGDGNGEPGAAGSSFPIHAGGRPWGVLSVASSEHDLHDEDRFLFDAAVAQIGLALQLGEVLGRVERTFTDT
jgi:hypothetical protein